MPGDPTQPSFDFGTDRVAPPRRSSSNRRRASGSVRTPVVPVADPPVASGADETRIVRVRPDVAGIDKCFDYRVPASMADEVRVGTMVRILLHGRRVGGWVVADPVEPPAGVVVQPLAKVSGWGPPAEILDLAEWASWRWAGRTVSVLRTASPDGVVRGLPRLPARPAAPATTVAAGDLGELAEEALRRPISVLRLPPASDPYALLVAASARGPALVIGPSARTMRHLGLRLRRAGVPVAVIPQEWAVARAGGATVLGARTAAWAPLAGPSAVIVLDEHDESLQQEQAPTWHARDVAIERARRADVPCVLVSPTPSLEALAAAPLLTPSRTGRTRGLAARRGRRHPRAVGVRGPLQPPPGRDPP